MTSAAHIRTGGMRHLCELQAKNKVPDVIGGNTSSWVKERDAYCQIRPLSGSKTLDAMRLQSEVTHEIYTRYAPDVAPGVIEKKRIVYDGTPYMIVAAMSPGEMREFVHMFAERGVPT